MGQTGLRAALIELHQRVHDAYSRHFTDPQLTALRTGEPVVVADWELPDEHCPPALPGEMGTRWYRLEVDGSLTPLHREDGR